MQRLGGRRFLVNWHESPDTAAQIDKWNRTAETGAFGMGRQALVQEQTGGSNQVSRQALLHEQTGGSNHAGRTRQVVRHCSKKQTGRSTRHCCKKHR